jgi:repressor LexA
VPKHIAIDKMAERFNINPVWLMGANVDKYLEINMIQKKIPVVGTIAAGQPLYAEENIVGYECVQKDQDIDFCLIVKGDSMINAGIHDGDIVFIRKQSDVENGEIAAVIIDGQEATLKRVYKTGDAVILRSENPKYEGLCFQQKRNERCPRSPTCVRGAKRSQNQPYAVRIVAVGCLYGE